MTRYVKALVLAFLLGMVVSLLTGYLHEDETRADMFWQYYGWPISCIQNGDLSSGGFNVEPSRFLQNAGIWFLVFAVPMLGLTMIRKGGQRPETNSTAAAPADDAETPES